MGELKGIDNCPELLSPFDQVREVDAEGREWWNGENHLSDTIRKIRIPSDKWCIIQDREIMSDFDKQLKLLFGDKEGNA